MVKVHEYDELINIELKYKFLKLYLQAFCFLYDLFDHIQYVKNNK